MGNFNKFVIASSDDSLYSRRCNGSPLRAAPFRHRQTCLAPCFKVCNHGVHTDRMEQIRKNNEMLMGRAPMKTISPDITFDANDKLET